MNLKINFGTNQFVFIKKTTILFYLGGFDRFYTRIQFKV